MSYIALGQACPQCSIASGTACIPCPDGSELPECQGCVGGRPPNATFLKRHGAVIAVGVVTSLIVAATSAVLLAKIGRGK